MDEEYKDEFGEGEELPKKNNLYDDDSGISEETEGEDGLEDEEESEEAEEESEDEEE